LILQPTLFAPIIQYVIFANAEEITFEVEDNFQKQTYRNRYYIYGANGKQLLNVPIVHAKGANRVKTKEVKIDASTSWQKLHLKTLDAAYSSSPFYEFYRDDLLPIFQKKFTYLLDLNLESIAIVNACLELEFKIKKTKEFHLETPPHTDFRNLAVAKQKQDCILNTYTQVFDNKHGYITNLSILDLLFNEGTSALLYLEAHNKYLKKNYQLF